MPLTDRVKPSGGVAPAGSTGPASGGGGGLLSRVQPRARRTTGAQKQKAVEETRVKVPGAKTTLGVMGQNFKENAKNFAAVIVPPPGMDFPLPDPNAPGGAVFDISNRPPGYINDKLDRAANFGEAILGNERIVKTRTDVEHPYMDVGVNLAAMIPQMQQLGKAGIQTLAPKLQNLPALGQRLTQAVGIGAPLGAMTELRQRGLEDPAGIGTAALQGAGGFMLPGGTFAQVAGEAGFDAVTALAELARTDPALAERASRGEFLPGDKEQIALTLGTNVLPSAGQHGLGSANERLRTRLMDEAKSKSSRAYTDASNQRIEDLQARLGPEIEDEQAMMDMNRLEADQEERGMRELFDLQRAQQEESLAAPLPQADVRFGKNFRRPVPSRLLDQQLERPLPMPELRASEPADFDMRPRSIDPNFQDIGGAPYREPEFPLMDPFDRAMLEAERQLPQRIRAHQRSIELPMPPREQVRPDMDFMEGPRPQIVPEFSARSPEIAPTPEAAPKPIEPVAAKVAAPIAKQPPPQVAQPTAMARGTYRFPDGRSVASAREVLIPGWEDVQFVAVPPAGSKASATKTGWMLIDRATGTTASQLPYNLEVPGDPIAALAKAFTDRVGAKAASMKMTPRALFADMQGKAHEALAAGKIRGGTFESKAAPNVAPAGVPNVGGGAGLPGRRSRGRRGAVINPLPAIVQRVQQALTPKPIAPATLDPNGKTISRQIPAQAGKNAVDWWTRTRLEYLRLVHDDLVGVQYAVNQIDPKVGARLNAYLAARMARYSGDRATAALTDGFTLPDGRPLGPSLRGILTDMELSPGVKVKDKIEDFENYLIARRVKSLADTRADDVGDKARNGTLVPDMPYHKADTLTRQWEAMYPGARAAGDAIHQFMRSGLQYAKAQGRLSDTDIHRIELDNEFYVPLQREIDDPDAHDPFDTRLEGSVDHAVLPPIESIVGMVDKIVRQADSGRVFQDLFQMADKNKGNGLFETLDNQGVARLMDKLGAEEAATLKDALGNKRKATAGEREALAQKRMERMYDEPVKIGDRWLMAGRVGGKRVFAEVDPIVFKGLQALHPQTRSVLAQYLGAPLRGMRNFAGKAITQMPGFVFANVARGFSSRALLSKRGMLSSLPGIEDARAMKMMMEMTPEDRATMRMYRAFGPNFADESFSKQVKNPNPWPWERGARAYGNRKKFLQKYAPSTMRKTLRSPADFYRWAIKSAEGAVRVPEFKAAYDAHLKNDPADTEGALRSAFQSSADIGLDFRRGGTLAKAINEYILFANPAVQGLEQTAKALASPRTLGRGLFMLGGMSVASMLAVGDDPDWQNLPDWEKDAYWFFPNPAYNAESDPAGDKWVRIPKQPGFGIFTTPIEAGMQWNMSDPNWKRRIPGLPGGAFSEVPDKGQAVMDDIINNFMPTAAVPIIDAFVRDRDSFSGRDFTSVYDEEVTPSERYSIYSSPTMIHAARVLSDAGLEIDPDKLEHILSGAGQSVFKEAERFADQAIFDDPTLAASKTRTPVVGRFLRDAPSGLNSLPVNRFFDEYERGKQLTATYKAMERRKEFDRMKEFRAENKAGFERAKAVESTMEFVKARIKAARSVLIRKDLSDEERQQRIEEINKVMTERVDKYWKQFNNEPISVQ